MAGSTNRKKRRLSILKKTVFAISAFITLSACGRANQWPSLDESGLESASSVPSDPTNNGTGANAPAGSSVSSQPSQKLVINQAMTLRYQVNDILESKFELPVGTQIEIPSDYQVKNLNYRNSDGTTAWSSTGFLTPLKIISVPPESAGLLPGSKINELNQMSNNLFLSAAIVGLAQGVAGNFDVLTAATVSTDGFIKNYNAAGKPLVSFLSSVNKRFAAKLNQGVVLSSLSASDQSKWQSIYNELKKAADRTSATPKSILMIDLATATQWSLNYEKTGVVSPNGAWTIATESTAVRHGFENVPCAEFMSEMVREAYQRAGYRASDDFTTAKGNQLIWSNTAAVVNFSMALYTAGWIPWDPRVYRPLTGSLLMNGSGLSPGHTYIAAGSDGTFIVDNGAPQGRDLRKTSQATIEMMYQTGVFFLPPGITPPLW